jgi:hypothetical protein
MFRWHPSHSTTMLPRINSWKIKNPGLHAIQLILTSCLVGGCVLAMDITVKRRSPLSISAMRPIHPLLAGTDEENLTFDRSDKPDRHPVNVRLGDKLLTDEEIEDFLSTNNRTLPRRNWIPKNVRTGGLLFTILPLTYVLYFLFQPINMSPNCLKIKLKT